MISKDGLFFLRCCSNLLMLNHLEMNLGDRTLMSFCVLIEEFLCEEISEEYRSFLCCNNPTYSRVASIKFLSLITLCHMPVYKSETETKMLVFP